MVRSTKLYYVMNYGGMHMNRRIHQAAISAMLILVMICVFAHGAEMPSASQSARDILAKTGVKGGLVVHVGCDDGTLTTALRANSSYLVHGLDTDMEQVEEARRTVHDGNLYGPVCIDHFDGDNLPYIDNIVNLIVAEEPTRVSAEEMMRVLAPQGVMYVQRNGRWTKTIKPRPEQIDEWTHYMHDASGNAVAHDTVVGPPRHFQWIGSPRWSRHHEHMSSISGAVSANGRLFYIVDEGPKSSIHLPAEWKLVARDAFNGAVLWKRDVPTWFTQLWPLKSGPAQLPRRIIAIGDRVYVTLGIDAALVALDAATGELLRTYEGTAATEEVIYCDGILFVVVNDDPMDRNQYVPKHMICWNETGRVAKELAWNEQPRSVMAVQPVTGSILWRSEQVVTPLTLAADSERVYFHTGKEVMCLNRKDGNEVWRSEPLDTRSPLAVAFAPTLVVHEDVVLFAGGRRGGKNNVKSMSALSAETGKTLWTEPHPRAGHHSPEDVLVIDGLVWSGAIASGRDSGLFTGRDPKTGQVKRTSKPDVDTYWFHHRCYRSKATDRFILSSRTGVEFIDVRTAHWDTNHWVRGACVYGVMPANGLLYAPPHPCACYMEAKLNGFCALAPHSELRTRAVARGRSNRLQRGSAYSQMQENTARESEGSWPTYRCDPARSGCAKGAVRPQLRQAWRTQLNGKLSSVVMAEGKVFVASVDTHTVYALDEESGDVAWTYTAGGRVDSPPTIWGGRAIFGCADGWVYCLHSLDGELIWRYRAAPADLRLIAYEQLESVWPVHGSVLVQDGVVQCVAGRSMFLDRGMRLVRLDVRTGEQLSETVLDDKKPEGQAGLQSEVRVLNMPVALPDILSCDGESVYMRSQRFDMQGNRLAIETPDSNPAEQATRQTGEGRHLFCPAGFLDSSWFHRSYWLYGKTYSSGCNWWFRAGRMTPAGRLLVFDGDTIYGFGRDPHLFVWSHALEYHLFAADKEVGAPAIERVAKANEKTESEFRRAIFDRSVTKRLPREDMSAVTWHWSKQSPPLHARAMVLTDGALFVAGYPDVLDEEKAYLHPHDPDIRAQSRAQKAANEGRAGGLLWAVSTKDGSRLADYKLESPPVWDGMAAAPNCLVFASMDGSVVCMTGR